MKAPDKIYLHGYEFDKTPCDRWDAEPTPKKMFGYKAKFVEYIRKDALLEWIEKTAIFYKEKIQEGEPWSEIRLEVCEHLISKINKL